MKVYYHYVILCELPVGSVFSSGAREPKGAQPDRKAIRDRKVLVYCLAVKYNLLSGIMRKVLRVVKNC